MMLKMQIITLSAGRILTLCFSSQVQKKACDKFDPSFYPKFKKWCDDYFFIKVFFYPLFWLSTPNHEVISFSNQLKIINLFYDLSLYYLLCICLQWIWQLVHFLFLCHLTALLSTIKLWNIIKLLEISVLLINIIKTVESTIKINKYIKRII